MSGYFNTAGRGEIFIAMTIRNPLQYSIVLNELFIIIILLYYTVFVNLRYFYITFVMKPCIGEGRSTQLCFSLCKYINMNIFNENKRLWERKGIRKRRSRDKEKYVRLNMSKAR